MSRPSAALGLVVDGANNKLYYRLGGSVNQIRVKDLNDGNTNPGVLLRSVNTTVNSLDLDPQRQRLYWTDNEAEFRIKSMSTDGSGVQTVVQRSGFMSSVVVDPSLEYLFWMEAGLGIYRAKLNGSNQVQMAPYAGNARSGLVLDGWGNRAYWTEVDKIRYTDLLPGSSVNTLMNLSFSEGALTFLYSAEFTPTPTNTATRFRFSANATHSPRTVWRPRNGEKPKKTPMA